MLIFGLESLVSACSHNSCIVVVMFLFTFHALLQFCTLYILNLNQTINNNTTQQQQQKENWVFSCVFLSKHCTSHNTRSHTTVVMSHHRERELCCLLTNYFILSKKYQAHLLCLPFNIKQNRKKINV